MEWRFIFVGVLGIDDFWWIGIAPLDTTTTAFAIAESYSSSEPWPSFEAMANDVIAVSTQLAPELLRPAWDQVSSPAFRSDIELGF
jgi:hypothetical protein